MSNGIDIGTLTGRIELEDALSSSITSINLKLDQLDNKFTTLGHGAAEMAAGFFTAEVAFEAAKKAGEFLVETFQELTMGGAAAADISENFDHLTEQAGVLGDTLLGTLKEGTHGTIEDLTLMKTVNADLAAGMVLSNEQFKTLSEGAFALAQATGEDVASAFEKMNDAMLTGRTRSVEMLTGKIDLAEAEKKYAESLGVTADHLSEEGKLEAKRLAIIESVAAATGRLGEQTDGLDEKVAQLQTQWANYEEELAKSIATSPHVIGAFDAIQKSIVEAFGGDTEDMIKTVVGWVDNLADSVAQYGPIVVGAFKTTKEWVVSAWEAVSKAAKDYGPIVVHALSEVKDFVMDLWEATTSTWNALPDWMKEVAKDAVIAAAGIKLIDSAVGAAGGGMDGFISNWGNLTTSLTGLPILVGHVSKFGGAMKDLIAVSDFSSLSQGATSLRLMATGAVTALGPVASLGIAAAAMMAAWEIGKMDAVSDFFQKIGLRAMGYSSAQADAVIATEKLTRAQAEQAAKEKEQSDLAAQLKTSLDEMAGAMNNVKVETDGAAEVGKKNSMVLAATTEELKKQKDAMDEIASAGKTWQETLKGVSEETVKIVKQHLEAGVAADKLATAYALTATQMSAITKSLQEQQKATEITKKSIDETRVLWDEYYALIGKHSGSSFEQQKNEIKAWYDHEVAKLKDSDKNWSEHYDAIGAVAKEKLHDIEVDWDELNKHSKKSLEDQADMARKTYEEAAGHADNFTKEYIDHLKKVAEAAQRAASDWKNSLNAVVDESIAKVRTLSGEMISAAESAKRMSAGGSSDINRSNLASNAKYWGIPETMAFMMAERGFSFQEMIQAFQANMVAQWVPHGPRIPGFKEGGAGDFGDGTLAMLHGKEIITPIDKVGGMGGVNTFNFYVNGTAQESAREIKKIIMNDLKRIRQFGAA